MSEDNIDITQIDTTKQTITLGSGDEPQVSLMEGHVDELTFVKAFREEGWNNDGTEPTEEEWKQMAEDEKGELVHRYGKFDSNGCNGKGSWSWGLDKEDEGAIPITIRLW
jgi:hypothetical protein